MRGKRAKFLRREASRMALEGKGHPYRIYKLLKKEWKKMGKP